MNQKKQNPIGNLRKKQKAETYELIFNTAGDLFESIGFEKTTIRKVAAKAGISPGAIFKHFENKSAILAAKLYNDIEITQEQALKTIPQGTTVQKQFLYITEQFFKYYEIRPVLSKMLVQHSIFIGGEWAEKLEEQIRRLGDKFVLLIENAKKRKEIRENVDSEVLARSLWSHYLFVLVLVVNAPVFNAAYAVDMLEVLVNQTFSGAAVMKNKRRR